MPLDVSPEPLLLIQLSPQEYHQDQPRPTLWGPTPASPFAHTKLTIPRPDLESPQCLSFTGRIRAYRQKLGLTQRELGEKLGVIGDTIQNWEHGHTYPGLRQAPKMAQIGNPFPVFSTRVFGTRLLLARRRLGLSQAELATRLGMSKNTIWEWEHGNHEPRAETRVAIDRLIEEALSEDERVAMRIRSLRTGLGLTQRELAARLGVYPKTVSRWERGRRRPSEETMERVERLWSNRGVRSC